MDNDRYPTAEELMEISSWPLDQIPDLIDRVEELWKEGSMFVRGHDIPSEIKHLIRIHFEDNVSGYVYMETGGCRGNEDLIGALRSNTMFWMTRWTASFRGGGYLFKID